MMDSRPKIDGLERVEIRDRKLVLDFCYRRLRDTESHVNSVSKFVTEVGRIGKAWDDAKSADTSKEPVEGAVAVAAGVPQRQSPPPQRARLWFRGETRLTAKRPNPAHPNVRWFRIPEPGLLREPRDDEGTFFAKEFAGTPLKVEVDDRIKHVVRSEKTVVDRLRTRVPFDGRVRPSRDLEWHFIAQHFGMATRLLDWTGECLTALYFSLHGFRHGVSVVRNDPKYIPCDGSYGKHGWKRGETRSAVSAVWVMDPEKLVQLSNLREFTEGLDAGFSAYELERQGIDSDYFSSERWRDLDPVPVMPRQIAPRVAAQQSRFTLHGMRCNRLSELLNLQLKAGANDDEVFLQPIVISRNAEERQEMRVDLFRMGVNAISLFPDVEGLRAFGEYAAEHLVL